MSDSSSSAENSSTDPDLSNSTEYDSSDANSSASESSSDADSSASEMQPPSKRLKASDRVSALPDPILHQILCFQDMKEVVRTSKLSRRWRSVWKSVPTLNFIFPSSTKESIQMYEKRFVDRVFLLRNENANVEKLFFSCYDINYDDLDNWITAAERRSVKQLCLDLKSNDGISVLPPFIFNSNVKVFKLQCVSCVVKVPISICFALNLQTIELLSAMLPDSNLRKEVEISCPVLEELRLNKCHHYKLETVHISAPQLKNLVLEDPHFFHIESCCKLKLCTPNLTSLKLKGRLYSSYSLGTLPSLVNATFEAKGKLVGAGILHEVLSALCNVKNLQVSGLFFNPCAESSAMLDQLLNPFLNLRHLRLIGFLDGSCVHLIYNLLTNTRTLENLALEINQKRMDKDWVDMFQCVSRLKSIEINEIEGREDELDFFKFVLEAAVSLVVFNVIPNDRFLVKSKKEKANFTMKMYSLPRASSMVQVFFFQ